MLGGPHVSAVPEEPLASGAVDCVIRGEGEETLLELAGGAELDQIAGLSYRQGESVCHTSPRRPPADLDERPYPAYDLIDPRQYGVTAGRARRHPAASMITTRGCPFGCHFCQVPKLGKPFRSRSAKNVVGEIELLQKRYGVLEISFQDDVLTANRKNLLELCEMLRRSGLDISWSCLSRVDTVDREMLRTMKAAGCHQIGFGVESGSDATLSAVGKNTTIAQARAAVRLAQEERLEVAAYFILGLDGETRQSLRQTLRFSRELRPDYCLYNIAVPFPGTHLYERAQASGQLISGDWSRFNGAEVVLEMPGLSASDIEDAYRNAYRRFYFDPIYLLKRASKVRSLSHLTSAIGSAVRLWWW